MATRQKRQRALPIQKITAPDAGARPLDRRCNGRGRTAAEEAAAGSGEKLFEQFLGGAEKALQVVE